MKKIILFLAFIAMAGGSAFAQGYTSIHYDIGIPLGKTSDQITKGSFRGVGLDYRKEINPNLAAGFSLGWQVFYQRNDYATYTGTIGDKTVDLTGVQYNYLNAIPLHVNINYYLGDPGNTIRPYIGLGIGTTYFERRVEMGLYASTINAWQFSIQPEAGFIYELSDTMGAFVGAKYTQGFTTDKLDGQSYISINVGFAWKLN
jgi:outer membrane protein W